MQAAVKNQLSRLPSWSISSTRKSILARSAADGKVEEQLASLAHDARNVVAALRLYCDLLAEPGVLTEEHGHFAAELQTVASAGCGLVEQLAALSMGDAAAREASPQERTASPVHATPIDDLATEVEYLKGPLAALAGAAIRLEMECLPCSGRIGISREDLTRILINLTRNAAEAMPRGGRIRVSVQQGGGGSFFDGDMEFAPRTALLCVQDSGPGIAKDQMEHIFDAGFTTKESHETQRGLGLHIVRRLAETAGGSVRAVAAPGGGSRFEIELPMIHRAQRNSGFLADFPERTNLEC